MATSSEDILGELYGWDSTIDEMYERGVDHADFDEDDALEAYEEIIQVGAAPDQASDAVLSLAAQLLTKHFYKFPHVHRNIVDVLLALCAATRPQAVRIHSVRSLLQIVKSAQSTKPPLVAACRDRIGAVVAQLLEVEKSNVIVRHLTQLQDALVVANGEVQKQETKDKWVEKREQSKLKKEAEKLEKTTESQAKAEQRSKANDTFSKTDGKDAIHERDESRRAGRAPEQNQTQHLKRAADAPLDRDNDRGLKRERRLSSGSLRNERNTSNNNHDAGCPPSAYIFVGSVPRGTDHSDIINYLSCIDESIDYHCVQIKYPTHGGRGSNSAGYAFVSLKSTDHARRAIRHIQTTEFNGRKLIGDFARGPHCATLQFVERDPALRMHDGGAFAVVDFSTLDASVWEELLSELKRYGSLDVVRLGCVRFRDLENAKTVIRQNRIRVRGHDFLPVSDPEEQAAIDSAKRRPRSRSDVDGGDGNSRRGRGDQLSRYGGGNGDQRQRGDQRRTSPARDQREEPRRRRSPSVDRPARDDKPVQSDRQERRRNPQYGEFVPARYGPAPTTTKSSDSGARGQRERSPDAKRGGPNHSSSRRRSRSRSPIPRITGDEKTNGRNRSQSPDSRQAMESDQARVDDRRPRDEMKNGSRSDAPPPRSRQESPTRRNPRETTRRSPSPSTPARQDASESTRRDADAHLSPPRGGRSRSPRRPVDSSSVAVGRRDKPTSRSRSQSPCPHDSDRRRDAPLSRRKSDDRSVAEIAREEAERQRSLKQQRDRERDRERNRDRERGRQQENRRRDKTPSRMSKYGPGRGADRSPTRARNESVDTKPRSRSRDSGGSAARGRADDKPRGDEPSTPEPSSATPTSRDRRASPPREHRRGADDRNGRLAPETRSRSPPPRSPRVSPPPASRDPAVRRRSPDRMAGQKRERSRSPQQQRRDGAETRRARVEEVRGNGSAADRGQEQRQPNRARSRSRSTEKRRAKMEDRPRGGASTNGERESGRQQRGKSPPKTERGKEREVSMEKRRSPVRRDQRKRSESPVRPPRVKPAASAVSAAVAASAPVRLVDAKPSSASIYDIDECMVDYDEDDD